MPRGDYPSAKQDQYMVRLPDGMRDRLKEAAADNNRSLNAEIVSRLEDTLGGVQFALPGDIQRRLRAAAEANHRHLADELWHGLRTLYPAPKEVSLAEFEDIYMRVTEGLPEKDREGAIEWLRYLKPRLIAKAATEGSRAGDTRKPSDTPVERVKKIAKNTRPAKK